MKLTITLLQRGKKGKTVVTKVDELTLEQLRGLWVAEQTLNGIPGADLRVHVSVEEG